jgi:hypothetical protein
MGRRFDERDLVELIQLAAYLEEQTECGKFPKARFNRYSNTLDRLVRHLAGIYSEPSTFDR